jgi:hypothetical protein
MYRHQLRDSQLNVCEFDQSTAYHGAGAGLGVSQKAVAAAVPQQGVAWKPARSLLLIPGETARTAV